DPRIKIMVRGILVIDIADRRERRRKATSRRNCGRNRSSQRRAGRRSRSRAGNRARSERSLQDRGQQGFALPCVRGGHVSQSYVRSKRRRNLPIVLSVYDILVLAKVSLAVGSHHLRSVRQGYGVARYRAGELRGDPLQEGCQAL